jgi:hypothetical protein
VVLSFQETPFEHKLPKVNAVAVKAMFGKQVQEWVGKRITFYGTTAIMPYKDEPCIRVFGSPDIKADVRCEWTPPRRKPVVQILKPVHSPVLIAALAAIEAAADSAALDKFTARADTLLKEGKINDAEHTEIAKAIAARFGDFDLAATEEQVPAPVPVRPAKLAAESATLDTDARTGAGDAGGPGDERNGQGAGDPTSDAEDAGDSDAGEADAGDLGSDPIPAAVNPPTEPAASVDLKLKDRQQLIRSANALTPERKAAFLASVSLDGAPQLKTEAHANAFSEFIKGQ